MKIAYLFPGQGAQYVGMGEDLYENSQPARAIFDEADRVLGFPLSRLCFKGPFEELTKTENCQPAVLTTSVAALEVLKIRLPQLAPSYVAGLSLGEYSALVAASILNFADVVHLVRKRAEFMEMAGRKNPGGMQCILGLDIEAVRRICQETGCEIANLNCPGQVVISGRKDKIEAAGQMAMAQGAQRVVSLDVSGAFHCSLMDEASQKLKAEIERVKFHKPKCPLISNVDAAPQANPDIIKANLIKQVNSATYWEKSMRYALAQQVNTFLEIGPGNVLKGLFKKIDPLAKVVNVGRWEEIQRVESKECL